jgi:hypothetical protein
VSTIISILTVVGIIYVGLTTFEVIKGGLEAVIVHSGIEGV